MTIIDIELLLDFQFYCLYLLLLTSLLFTPVLIDPVLSCRADLVV
jgi:hypothetical protein